MKRGSRFFTLSLPLVLGGLAGCAAYAPLREAPPGPDKPHQVKEAAALGESAASEPGKMEKALPDPDVPQTLPMLIDLAQRNNRATRVAWQSARAAAIAQGLSASEFYPMLAVAASYGAGYWDMNLRFNNDLSGLRNAPGIAGALFADAPEDVALDTRLHGMYQTGTANLGLRWMLFDFGARSARLDSAKNLRVAAGLGFNDAHRKVAEATTLAYYAHEAARGQRVAAADAVSSARQVLDAAAGRFERGLLPEQAVAAARQALAEADYELATASAAEEIAWIDLAQAAGCPPGAPFRIAAPAWPENSQKLQTTLDGAVNEALRNRPDLLAKAAAVQASESSLRAARADILPRLALEAIAGGSQFESTVSGAGPLDQFGLGLQNYGALLTVQWPVFTGFAERNRILAAETARDAAREELELSRERVIGDVWRAYTRAKNALARLDAASALHAACKTQYDATLAGFNNGLRTVQELLTARAAEAQSAAMIAESRAALCSATAALAFEQGRTAP